MKPTELIVFSVCVAIVLVAPFLPSALLMMLDHLVVRVVLIAGLLWVTRMGATAALFAFMAVAILLVERNRRKVSLAQKALDAMDSEARPAAELSAAFVPAVTTVEFNRPAGTEVGFLPVREMDTAEFEPVADSINEKVVMESVYRHGSASAAAELFEGMGAGHLDHVSL
jgi:hypothetical protein